MRKGAPGAAAAYTPPTVASGRPLTSHWQLVVSRQQGTGQVLLRAGGGLQGGGVQGPPLLSRTVGYSSQAQVQIQQACPPWALAPAPLQGAVPHVWSQVSAPAVGHTEEV
jgi:hypothetical protein